MSPTSYQTAPPRVAGGGAIIVRPSAGVQVPVNAPAPFPIPVPCARVLAWFGLGRGAMKRLLALLVVLAAGRGGAARLPGFGVRFLGTTAGFASSVAVDSRGTVYYTTTEGGLFRIDGGVS